MATSALAHSAAASLEAGSMARLATRAKSTRSTSVVNRRPPSTWRSAETARGDARSARAREALAMFDEVLGDLDSGGWGLPARPVVADAGYGHATEFRAGLAGRDPSYVVAVKRTTSA